MAAVSEIVWSSNALERAMKQIKKNFGPRAEIRYDLSRGKPDIHS
jgi:hypothetical protein